MKRIVFIFFLVVIIVILVLISCISTSLKGKNVDLKNARDSVNWPGVYKGIYPLYNGLCLDIRLKLFRDQGFSLYIEYLDKSHKTIDWKGSFKWDVTGNIIILDIIDAPLYYKVTENKLIQLDDEGKPVAEELADYFVLRKER